MKNINKLKILLDNSVGTNSENLTRIVVNDGIEMINIGTNPDKVLNWVDNLLFQYDNKPKPLSEKERENNLKKIQLKKEKKVAKEASQRLLVDRLNTIINGFDIKMFAFFDYKADIEFIISKLTQKYEVIDRGDGAFELIVSKIKIDQKTYKEIKSIENELNEIGEFYETKCNAEMIFDDKNRLTNFLLNS